MWQASKGEEKEEGIGERKKSLFHYAVFLSSLRFLCQQHRLSVILKVGVDQHRLFGSSTWSLIFQTVNHCMIATFHWPENRFPDFHVSFIFFLKVVCFPFPFTWCFQEMVFFSRFGKSISVNIKTFFDNNFRFHECFGNPDNETSWLLSDFAVNLSQPHIIIAFSLLFTYHGNRVFNITLSKD